METIKKINSIHRFFALHQKCFNLYITIGIFYKELFFICLDPIFCHFPF